ncbi:hypothetical protein GO755_29575 [Spirosoma sp. HMF4905]|uniref:Uncharacterized protein n=1 Tax=Spirosoma arboris TaxID=2682092 RepID=A0A7K1SKE2_9BACT|nr:hypothetical protein [Spirosoma arboris]MVM34218.1 hypothetical protein [Spirosoma arboris]
MSAALKAILNYLNKYPDLLDYERTPLEEALKRITNEVFQEEVQKIKAKLSD